MKNKIWKIRHWLFRRSLILLNKSCIKSFDKGKYMVDISKLNKIGRFSIKFIKPPHFTKVIIK